MILEVKPGKSFYIDIVLEEESVFRSLSIEKKADFLSKALSNLEKDIESISDLVDSVEFSRFYWCHTYMPHRDDGIRGTVLQYYIIEIIEYLCSQTKINEIKVYTHIPPWILKRIFDVVKIKPIVIISWKDKIQLLMKESFGPLRYLVKYFSSSFKSTGEGFNIKLEGSFLFLYSKNSLSRLKSFPQRLLNKRKYILDESLMTITDLTTNRAVNSGIYKPQVFLIAFIKAFRFQFDKATVLSGLTRTNLFANYIIKQSFFQSYFIMVRDISLNELFSRCKPDYLIVSTNFGDPLRRQVIAVAKAHGIESINFACRPMFSYLRAEDRAINADIERKNSASIPKFHIVFDKVSYSHLVSSKINPKRIFVHNPTELLSSNLTVLIENAIVILFAHETYNSEIIDCLHRFQNKGLSFEKIYYREHPLQKISEQQKNRLLKLGENVTQFSDILWSNIVIKNSVCFTSNSTSAIDALSRGAGIIWLPYLTEHSTQFKPMMDTTGIICNSEEDFFSVMRDFQISPLKKNEFVKSCMEDYEKDFNMVDTVDDLLSALK